MTVHCCRDAENVEAVITLFEAIAAAEGWQPGDELRRHQERSRYFALIGSAEGQRDRVFGGLQLVYPDDRRLLPSHNVWPELQPVSPKGGVAHIAVLAVTPERRKRGRRSACPEDAAVFWLLCLALWRHCVETGIRELWLEATPKMLRAYRFLGLPLTVQGNLRTHWGEPCYPCKLSVREVAGAVTEKALASETYRFLLNRAIAPDPGSNCQPARAA